MTRFLVVPLLVLSIQISLAQSVPSAPGPGQPQPQAGQQSPLGLYTPWLAMALLSGCVVLLYRNKRQQAKMTKLEDTVQRQQDQLAQTRSTLNTTQLQLEQAEKMASLGELTAGIAHEIQNPLNFVNNFSDVSAELVTELIEEQQKAERDTQVEGDILEDLKQNLQKISQHGKRAASITRNMLEHARSTPGERQLTDINALADEYLRLAYHGLRAKEKAFSCELVTDFDASVAKVPVVIQDIGRVFLNLFNNAFYAVEARRKQLAERQPNELYCPTVTVRTHESNEQVVICVRDNGSGIPDAIKAKIFQPFFTTKPGGEGTGLGLSLSYAIVTTDHGGSLTVESQEGEGTEFEIRLPVEEITDFLSDQANDHFSS